MGVCVDVSLCEVGHVLKSVNKSVDSLGLTVYTRRVNKSVYQAKKDTKMTQQAQPLKATFEHQGRTWTAWTNGKVYGQETRYITVSSDTRQFKVIYSLGKGTIDFGGAYGNMDCARAALRSLGFSE